MDHRRTQIEQAAAPRLLGRSIDWLHRAHDRSPVARDRVDHDLAIAQMFRHCPRVKRVTDAAVYVEARRHGQRARPPNDRTNDVLAAGVQHLDDAVSDEPVRSDYRDPGGSVHAVNRPRQMLPIARIAARYVPGALLRRSAALNCAIAAGMSPRAANWEAAK